MENIDWSKAPEGATHYQRCTGSYLACWIKKDDSGRLECMLDDGMDTRWDYAGSYKDKMHILIAHPQQTPWNGQGLPPVGTVCEVQNGHGDWESVTVLAHSKMSYGEDVVVFQAGDKITFSNPRYFRPIRTPEQIAADEREAAIEELKRE